MSKKFFKKNIFMIVFMTMSLIAVVALLVMVFFEHQSMKEYDKKKKELLEKIHKIVKQKHTPVKVNVLRMNKDVASYNQEINKLQKKFGHPYAKALKSFTDVVGIDLDEFKSKFGIYWEAEKGRATRDLIYLRYKVKQFNEDFPKHRSEWAQAMNAFMLEAQKATLEKIDATNVDGIFLGAMGKGRRFSDSTGRCLTFMKNMRRDMITYFGSKKIECEKAADFSFNYNQEPPLADIGKISRAWEIIADLTKRIANAKSNSEKSFLELVSFTKRGLDGEKDGNYTMYRFTFEVNADLDTIRRIVDKLYAAYTENRVYAVRDIKLKRIVDNVDKILEDSENVKDEMDYDPKRDAREEGQPPTTDRISTTGRMPAIGRRIPAAGRRSSPRTDQRDTLNPETTPRSRVARTTERRILGPKDPGYAETIVGKDNNCNAVFDVDYIVFDDSPNN